MCGIVGYVGSFDSSLLDQMSQMIRHRGPDDDGKYVSSNGQVGLAHRRLAILDLSKSGHQPMIAKDGSAIIIFNGEIYNFRELKGQLIDQGYSFDGNSDTEVLLNLYLRDGREMLDHLNGIFAFAIYNLKSDELFLARDHMGVKPLYYSEYDRGFIFASEIKSILMEPSVSREIDHSAVADHLSYLWAPSPKTILRHVRKLEPGHAITVRNGKIREKWCYYDIPFEINDINIQDAVTNTQQYLSNAVTSQLVSDVPIGAFLSGGLDSSAIVALAKKAQPDMDFKCFSIDFHDDALVQEGMVADLPYAKAVADHLGVNLQVVKVGSEMILDLENMIYYLDEPQADPAPLNALYISKLAREQGIKVLLSGAGGDDLFTGYRRHYALQQEHYWSWMPSVIRRGVKGFANSLPKDVPAFRRVAKAFAYADVDGDERLTSYFRWLDKKHVFSLMKHHVEEEPSLLTTLGRLQKDVHPLNRMLYLEMKHFLADHNLNYTDKMGMAVGVEVRVPLLDQDLVRFAGSLPVHFKQKGAVGKWIFKKSMEPYLPKHIIYRPKTGFGAPLRHWLRNELKEMKYDLLSENSINKRGLFCHKQVQALLSLEQAGKVDASYSIFSMMCIELWCRIFIDTSYPEERKLNWGDIN